MKPNLKRKKIGMFLFSCVVFFIFYLINKIYILYLNGIRERDTGYGVRGMKYGVRVRGTDSGKSQKGLKSISK